eukprot:SAG22_NODE_822_length_6994_cov_2.332560_3_plen_317_part_00
MTQVNTFGYPGFQNASAPDLATAADRPVYAALNMVSESERHNNGPSLSHSLGFLIYHVPLPLFAVALPSQRAVLLLHCFVSIATQSATSSAARSRPYSRASTSGATRWPGQSTPGTSAGRRAQCVACLSGAAVLGHSLPCVLPSESCPNLPPRGTQAAGNWSECFSCSRSNCAPSKPLGVPGSLTHLLLPYLTYYTSARYGGRWPVGADRIVSYNLARLVVRLLARSTYVQTYNASMPPARQSDGSGSGSGSSAAAAALPLNWFENMFGYFEVNPVKTIPLSREGVKMLVGSFGAVSSVCSFAAATLAYSTDSIIQ